MPAEKAGLSWEDQESFWKKRLELSSEPTCAKQSHCCTHFAGSGHFLKSKALVHLIC